MTVIHKPRKIAVTKVKGFAILYAVLMTSIVLTVSLGLLNITLKQLILSSVIKESQVAYYSALSAFRCTLRNDDHRFANPGGDFSFNNPFGYFQSAPGGIFIFTPPSGNPDVVCGDGVAVSLNNSSPNNINWDNSDPDLFISNFDIDFPNNRCAKVTVTKYLTGLQETGHTSYRALGYNTTCDSTNPRRVERTVYYAI